MDLNRSASNIRPYQFISFVCRSCGSNENVSLTGAYCTTCLRSQEVARHLRSAIDGQVVLLVRVPILGGIRNKYIIGIIEATESSVLEYLKHLDSTYGQTDRIAITHKTMAHLPYETPIEVVNLIKCAFNADGSVVNTPL